MKSSGAEIWDVIIQQPQTIKQLETEGFFEISSAELNLLSKRLGGPDARNLVKFDSTDRLPKALRVSSLAILPAARGKFFVGPYDVYLGTPEEELRNVPLRTMSFESDLHTLDFVDLKSESASLMAAHTSGMFSDFVGEDFTHTGFGKTSASSFSFRVDRRQRSPQRIQVEPSTPMEIDGVYESASTICLVEAKNISSRDFHLRQLYYPYRTMESRHTKRLTALLFTQTNGIFDFREIEFEDIGNISSYVTKKVARYTLKEQNLTKRELITLCKSEPARKPETSVSFPQADKFEKVLFVAEKLTDGPLDKAAIAGLFGYVPRQGDYYARAAAYLGLVRKSGQNFEATKLANELFAMRGAERLRSIALLLTSVPTIRKILLERLITGRIPSKMDVVEYMRAEGESDPLGIDTELRRANTALDWVDWLISSTS